MILWSESFVFLKTLCVSCDFDHMGLHIPTSVTSTQPVHFSVCLLFLFCFLFDHYELPLDFSTFCLLWTLQDLSWGIAAWPVWKNKFQKALWCDLFNFSPFASVMFIFGVVASSISACFWALCLVYMVLFFLIFAEDVFDLFSSGLAVSQIKFSTVFVNVPVTGNDILLSKLEHPSVFVLYDSLDVCKNDSTKIRKVEISAADKVKFAHITCRLFLECVSEEHLLSCLQQNDKPIVLRKRRQRIKSEANWPLFYYYFNRDHAKPNLLWNYKVAGNVFLWGFVKRVMTFKIDFLLFMKVSLPPMLNLPLCFELQQLCTEGKFMWKFGFFSLEIWHVKCEVVVHNILKFYLLNFTVAD